VVCTIDVERLRKTPFTTGRTSERIRDEDENGLQSVHPLEFLKQSEIKRRICLAIRQQEGLRLCFRLPVYFLDERELLEGDMSCALISLIEVRSIRMR